MVCSNVALGKAKVHPRLFCGWLACYVWHCGPGVWWQARALAGVRGSSPNSSVALVASSSRLTMLGGLLGANLGMWHHTACLSGVLLLIGSTHGPKGVVGGHCPLWAHRQSPKLLAWHPHYGGLC